MRLAAGGIVNVRAPENGDAWAADISVIAAEGERHSAAAYLTAEECYRLGARLLDMAARSRRRRLVEVVRRWFA